MCVFHTTEFAQVTFRAYLKPVIEHARIARFADKTAFFTVVAFALARAYRCIAVSALCAVNAAVQLLTTFTKAAIVAECAHTAFAEPALTAEALLVGIVTLVTTEAVPAVIDVAVLAGPAFRAPVIVLKAGTAFITVLCEKTNRIGTLGAATAAHTAHIFVPMVVAAARTVLTVLIVCVCKRY